MAIRLKRPSGVTVHRIVVCAPTRKKKEALRDFDERLDAIYDEMTAEELVLTLDGSDDEDWEERL